MTKRPAKLATIVAGLFLATNANAAERENELEHARVTVTTTEGLKLAAYISRPKGSSVPLPSLFFTQYVSCGSVAPRNDRQSRQELVALEANHALIRVERSGTGESEGEGCDTLDYETEVRHYREAFDQVRQHSWVDADHIVIMGSSLGSTVAPLVAKDTAAAGVIVQGAGALTYFERMVFFDRLQLERTAKFEPAAIDREMRRRVEFHHHYLLQKMTPDQITVENPHLEGVWESLVGTDATPHYGRPHAWHWQAADQNWLASWAELDVPVMVVFAQYEQFESRHGHRTIVDTINRLRPGSATWLEIPKAGHGLRIYDNEISAYSWEDGASRPELFVEPVADWLRTQAIGQR